MGNVVCPMCRKVSIIDIPGNDQYITCDQCEKKLDNAAKLICLECNKQIAWLEPGIYNLPQYKDLDFKVESKKEYHTEYCSKCNPGKKIYIIEQLEYAKSKGLEVNLDDGEIRRRL